jgi:hypothetical protein
MQSSAVARPAANPAGPVFVLCTGRSGSTLLRFVLDAHPELACPPEANMPSLAAHLATVWSLIEGVPLSSSREDEPPFIPDQALKGVRRTLDEITSTYLTRRGKQRFCDKSLTNARFVELMLRLYPEAKFICLYRHPMDMIASGIEACPWGLSGYGFDQYAAASPDNVVLALARYWSDNTALILSAEERFALACHRVRYEDLIADPEATAAAIFEFLGVAAAPGITSRCFSSQVERFGPSDHKIWHTSEISSASVGRGWSLPAGMIAPIVLKEMNELTANLGYLQVGQEWGSAPVPADLRVSESSPVPVPPAAPSRAAELIGRRLRASLARVDDGFLYRWGPCAEDCFMVAATPTTGAGFEKRWRVDLASRSVTEVADAQAEGGETAWDVVGATDVWANVLEGRVNMAVAIRGCQLRYCQAGDAMPVVPEARIALLADLLALPSWRPSRIAKVQLPQAT